MNLINEQWIHLKLHKKKRARRILISAGLIALLSVGIFCLAGYVSAHVETQPFLYRHIALLFALALLLFLTGVIVMLVSVGMSAKAEIPTDIFEIPPQLHKLASVVQQIEPIRSKSMYSFWPSLWWTLGLGIIIALGICWLVFRGFPEHFFIISLFFVFFVLLMLSLTNLITTIVSPRHHTQVAIDRAEKTISFTDLFTKKTRVYSFGELDGFVNVYYLVSTKSGYKKKYVISLVHQGTRVEKMSTDVITNIAELKIGLLSLRQLKMTDTLPIKL